MSTTARSTSHGSRVQEPVATTAVFAGCLLAVAGVCQALAGLSAVADDKVYVRGINYTYSFDLTAWGWIHIVVGAIALAAGIGTLVGQTWALVGGLVVAVVGLVANFAFLPYFPFWALVLLAMYGFVIWAMSHELGRDDRP